MATVQYIIDTICAKFTAESMYDLVKAWLKQGPCMVAEIAREVRCEGRSLDFDSSRMLAEAALEALEQRGDITIEGGCVYLAD